MSTATQVSATISMETREKLDRFTEELGLKKNFVVEQALLLYMDTRRTLPDEAFIPSRVVLDGAEFDALVRSIESPPAPTDALRELMRGQRR